MNRICSAVVTTVLILSGTATLAATDIVVGSSRPGGSYFLYTGGITTYLTERSKVVNATARTTRGSVENARLLNRRVMEAAFINAMVVQQNRAGQGPFKKSGASTTLRGIALIDTAPAHWVVLANSGIKVFADLKGKQVSIGAAGSGVANTAMTLLKVMGLFDKLKIKYLGFSESADNLRDGNLDAFSAGSALPMPAVVDISSRRKIHLLSVTPDTVKNMQKVSPATGLVTIPAGTYRGVDYDVTTVANPSTMMTHEGVPEAIVYEIVKHITTKDNRKYMQAIYRAWNPRAAPAMWKRIKVPMHPGAVRAYKEAGWIK